MSRKNNNALIVFIKYPEPEKVKTRLAEDIGIQRATEFYRETASFVANSFSVSQNWKTFFFYTPKERKKEMLNWLGGEKTFFVAQEGISLGDRISRAFNKCFSLGFENVAIIGTDCVAITREDVETTFALLSDKKFEAVLGPAKDGGYYLLGLSRQEDKIFQNIKWSTSNVLRETRKLMKKNGLRYVLIKELSDIDRESDINIQDIMKVDSNLGRNLLKILSRR